MKLAKARAILTAIFVFSATVLCQGTRLTGTLYDTNGAVIVNGEVEARAAKDRVFTGKSDQEGRFAIALEPGVYALKISGVGFLTTVYPEYLVVATDKMQMDVVMFPNGIIIDPCGPAPPPDCGYKPPSRKDYKISYSPSLRQLLKDFTEAKKSKE